MSNVIVGPKLKTLRFVAMGRVVTLQSDVKTVCGTEDLSGGAFRIHGGGGMLQWKKMG